MKKAILLLCVLISVFEISSAQKGRHSFKQGSNEFLMDGKPFQVISGEIFPARVPANNWRHRIQMAKALGCNTMTLSVLWNYHETSEGVFDFESAGKNLGQLLEICQDEEMFVILRPGPYVCSEWELGGIPEYLLNEPGIKLRSIDQKFMAAVDRYFQKLSEVIKPWVVTKGGPVILLQLENEYGSYGNDKNYLSKLKETWTKYGIDVPTYTNDVPVEEQMKSGSLPGNAVSISGSSPEQFDLASKIFPGVPVIGNVSFPEMTYWGSQPGKLIDSVALLENIRYLMDNRKSFNIAILNGGTNFGYSSGAHVIDGRYVSNLTRFNNNALISWDGQPTGRYLAARELINSYNEKGRKISDIPQTTDMLEVTPIFLQPFSSIWDNLPKPVASEMPMTFESLDQYSGYVLYRTELPDSSGGSLKITDVHDYALIFVNGKYIDMIRRGEDQKNIAIPLTPGKAVLDIFVEEMGHIDPADSNDRKGITRVILNENELTGWKMYKYPLDDKFVYDLRSGRTLNRQGMFFKGNFMIAQGSGVSRADTYIDISNFTKGVLWINGHNLGRYWNIGPQKRLYCPASMLREGLNEILIFDLHETAARIISGHTTME